MSNLPQATERRCSLCGRQAHTGQEHEILGWVGPVCYKRVAGLGDLLEALGLKNTGSNVNSIILLVHPDHQEQTRISSLKDRLRHAGLELTPTGSPFHARFGTAMRYAQEHQIVVSSRKALVKAVETYSERRNRFANELRAASEQRRYSKQEGIYA